MVVVVVVVVVMVIVFMMIMWLMLVVVMGFDHWHNWLHDGVVDGCLDDGRGVGMG